MCWLTKDLQSPSKKESGYCAQVMAPKLAQTAPVFSMTVLSFCKQSHPDEVVRCSLVGMGHPPECRTHQNLVKASQVKQQPSSQPDSKVDFDF